MPYRDPERPPTRRLYTAVDLWVFLAGGVVIGAGAVLLVQIALAGR